MPEYEFYCKRCHKTFTTFMHVKEHDLTVAECPKCHEKKEVQKLIPEVNVFTHSKSAGWR